MSRHRLHCVAPREEEGRDRNLLGPIGPKPVRLPAGEGSRGGGREEDATAALRFGPPREEEGDRGFRDDIREEEDAAAVPAPGRRKARRIPYLP